VYFLNTSAEQVLITYHSRVGNALDRNPDIQFEAQRLGVAQLTLMTAGCAALARYELIPRRIKVMREARRNNTRALRELNWIESVLRLADRNAGETTQVFDFEDPTSVSADAFGAVDVLTGHFKNAPKAEEELRSAMGVSKHARRSGKRAERESIGFLAFVLNKHFSDRRPHDDFVAKLASDVLRIYVTTHDVQHYRSAYARLQAL
jgi:hypothetical protein